MKIPKSFPQTFPQTLKTKALSFIVMSSMLATSVAAHAQDQTAEFQLVAKATAIQGEALSKSEMSDALKAAVQEYVLESSSERSSDQIANLEQAWIGLQMMTPAQAHEVSRELTQAVAQVASAPDASQHLSSADLINISSTILQHLNGAQFSQCTVDGSFSAAFFVGGIVAGIFGATYDAHEINGTGISVPARAIAKPLEVAGITAGLIGMVGGVMTMSYVCQN